MSEIKTTPAPKNSKEKFDWQSLAINLGMIVTTSILTGFCTAAGGHLYHSAIKRTSQKDNLLLLPGGKTGTHG